MTLFIICPAASLLSASELSGSKDTTMATLLFLYKLSHEIKVTYVQELIDALRYVGRTLLAARPLELAMGNVRCAPFHAFWPWSPFFLAQSSLMVYLANQMLKS